MSDEKTKPTEPVVEPGPKAIVVTPSKLSYTIEDYTGRPPSLVSTHDLRLTFSWSGLLSEHGFVAAPVSAFKHAPMADCWDNIIVGMKVEVENRDAEGLGTVFAEAYWVASVLRISGYKALLRYEGFGQDDSKDFWINLCSDKVHPVGWCATKGRPLIPPKSIQSKYADWKDFLVKRLTGARTLPSNFYNKVWESVGSIFKPGMKLEVVDKMRICQVRVATILEITGRRLYVQYDDVDHDDRGFWCHEESPLIHPVGWARKVGHQVVASQEYFERCAMDNYISTDCTSDMFPEYRPPPGNFLVGMKLEAVDPLNLAAVCVATVMKVLRFGYIMIRIDGYETDATGSDWFCYHASSPLIFPPGFCERNSLSLKPPAGFEDNFSWYEYLKETQSQAAPVGLFCQRGEIKHGFKVGMKLEASDQMDPRLICVSTISRIVGRLLKVHFDGWEDDYDQWMDCESVDIYPVGWGELVGHKLEGPRMSLPMKKEKKKPVGRKNKKRSATTPTPTSTPTSANSNNGSNGNRRSTTPTLASPTGSTKKPKKSPTSSNEASKKSTTSTSPLPPIPPIKISSPNATSETGEKIEKVVESAQISPPAPISPPLSEVKVIPRLVDSAGQAAVQRGKDSNLDPSTWSVEEVAQFLQINECASLVDAFTKQNIDGAKFLSMAKMDIMKLVNNKIGPCLKVENLLTLLKARMNPAQARFLATIRKTN